MAKTVEQKCSSRSQVAALSVKLPVSIKERRQPTEVVKRCLMNCDHASSSPAESMLSVMLGSPAIQERPRFQVGYDRMPAHAAAGLCRGRTWESGLAGLGRTSYFSVSS